MVNLLCNICGRQGIFPLSEASPTSSSSRQPAALPPISTASSSSRQPAASRSSLKPAGKVLPSPVVPERAPPRPSPVVSVKAPTRPCPVGPEKASPTKINSQQTPEILDLTPKAITPTPKPIAHPEPTSIPIESATVLPDRPPESVRLSLKPTPPPPNVVEAAATTEKPAKKPAKKPPPPRPSRQGTPNPGNRIVQSSSVSQASKADSASGGHNALWRWWQTTKIDVPADLLPDTPTLVTPPQQPSLASTLPPHSASGDGNTLSKTALQDSSLVTQTPKMNVLPVMRSVVAFSNFQYNINIRDGDLRTDEQSEITSIEEGLAVHPYVDTASMEFNAN